MNDSEINRTEEQLDECQIRERIESMAPNGDQGELPEPPFRAYNDSTEYLYDAGKIKLLWELDNAPLAGLENLLKPDDY